MTAEIITLNREAARRAGARDAAEIQARIDLAAWIDSYGDLGAPFLLSALRNATNAVEVFHDMMRE